MEPVVLLFEADHRRLMLGYLGKFAMVRFQGARKIADDLKAWLENLGFGKYADAFSDNDVGPDVLAELTKDDLKELGVSFGDRLRESLEHFGESHPTMTKTVGRVLDALSNMGI